MSIKGYTWEEVQLGIDEHDAALKKESKKEDIHDIMTEEANMQSAWGWGLCILGATLGFGPLGCYVGKQIGKWGADLAYDWESMEIDEDKFNVRETKKFNKELREKADELNLTQAFDSFIDLGKMWMQAGGLQEGFDPSMGGGDWTTFGTGDAAWSVFPKKGDPGSLLPPAGGAQGPPELVGATPGIPGLFSSDKPGVGSSVGSGIDRLFGTIKKEATVEGIGSSIDQWYKERM